MRAIAMSILAVAATNHDARVVFMIVAAILIAAGL